ncbi:MAG TPA: pyridoxamine 5'-phosphate oxidase family protein [Pseudonocardiaceae bacterium]
MVAWRAVLDSEPEFAQRAQTIMDAHRHKTIATLRADGSPRISGIEALFVRGELCFGSMPDARKGQDLRRDPRFALHSASVDPPEGQESSWSGDAKLSGRAVLVTDPGERDALLQALGAPPGQSSDVFRADIDEVVITRVGEPADHLLIELWRPDQPLHRIQRR